MKKHLFTRLLSLVLAAVMVLGLMPAASAAPAGLRWKKSDVDVSWDRSDRLTEDPIHTETAHKPTDLVRVSIVLDGAPTLKAGYATMDIGSNAEAIAYDLDLQKVQKTMARTISAQALDGKTLDVVWNLTLASNIISANVPYGKLDAIKAVPGVSDVVLEQQYELPKEQPAETNMYSSAGMVGATSVWQTGMTGAGSRVAIVDTGTDDDHQSFDNDAYLYALEQNAAAMGMGMPEYVASLELLDTAEIDAVLANLNATERIGATSGEYYLTDKLPFAANYVDRNLDINHDWDNQGSHGSHVAGIAAANRYIQKGASFDDARATVRMCGIAPDAQIITLKVFGNAQGPYDSDYFAAIEDAIWLGCDSVNLSLGSGAPGVSENPNFAELLDFLATTDTVVVMSAGNSGNWAEMTYAQYLYDDGVSLHTSGTPGTYTNSLSVASVENDGTVGKYVDVAGHMIVYTETTGYTNAPMASLDTSADKSGTEYEYIFVDGLGKETDYLGIDLNGKVVFCSRGETSFFEKGNVAAAKGAAAVIVCNNQPGIINMDLTGYEYAAPCVSILQSDAAAVKAASQQKTTAAGLVYYTGTVTVASELGATEYNSEYYTMSAFSSWGVPGSLEMKPEITAPGGLIWSVNGVDTSGSAYEMMSGTSMAAPQVTGMVALVAEYIRNTGLDEQTDLSPRQLAQSLLMSTAEPLREAASDGQYYSILTQGSGLARVDLATTAESYVLVEGQDDGKVKVELFDDPMRSGVYDFAFSLNNLNGEAMTYELSADLFTQDLFDGGNDTIYMDTWTRQLPVSASFAVNGISLEGVIDGFTCDLDGDGVTTAADADYLLEYLVGNETELKADGDVNGDGEVTSYDAHVLLTKLSGIYSVDVPANGSVTVEVQLALTEETAEYLNTYYPTGAYIEAYVYAEPVTDSEGVAGVTHSIPVLGYYGSWTEPSMYDVGSYVEYANKAETRAPYLYDINGVRVNYMTIDYGDGDEYLYGGNPLTQEAAYMPERNAFNNEQGAMLKTLRFTQIRNASASRIVVENAETGEVYMTQELGPIDSAYYHANQGAWQNTQYKISLGLDLADYAEGTRLNVSLESAPELNCTYDPAAQAYVADWDALADGARLTTSLTIDNTAPELMKVELTEDSVLKVTAKDNEYIAAVALMNKAGTTVLTAAPANQTVPGVTHTAELDLSYVFGENFLVAVFDYAENVAVYEVTLELDSERPYFTAIDRTNVNDDYSVSYVGMNADGYAVKLAANAGREPARAVEYVEGAVFEISNDNKLYVGFDEDLYTVSYLCDLDPTGEYQIVGFNDLAYNKADGKLYGNFYSYLNELTVPFLCTIDLYTGEMTVLGQMPIDANTMAIDGEGNFYSTIYGYSQLYTYRSDVYQTGKATYVGSLDNYAATSITSMAWDHNTDELYWACTGNNTTALLKIDPETAAVEYVSFFGFNTAGLYIAYEPENDLFAPTNEVLAVNMDETSSTVVGNTIRLEANLLPWNLSDHSVTWTSNNSDVAIVDETGLVYGLSEGTAVITATSVADPTKSASCTVSVVGISRDLKGLVWDEEGQVHWASFNTATLPNYTSLKALDPNLPVNATMVADGTLYASTLDTSTGLSDLYIVDPETFEMTYAGGSPSIAYMDIAYAPSLGYGLGLYFNYVCVIDLSTGDYLGAWDWTEGMAGDLVGITYYGSQYHQDYGTYMDYFLILDNQGNVYLDAFINTGTQMGYFNGPSYGYVNTIGEPVDYSYFQGFYFDGSYTYWTRFNEVDNIVELIAWDSEETGNDYSLGYFADGVWPVAGLYSDADINGTMALADQSLTLASIKTAELMTALPTVELKNEEPTVGVLNTVKPVKTMSAAETEPEADVAVAIALPEAATNGTATLTFDAAKVQLVDAEGQTQAFAWKQTGENEVTIAFAERTELNANAVAAVLNFYALDEGDTTMILTWGEYGEYNLELLQEITVKLPSDNPFIDVPEDSFYRDAVVWAVKEGITTGTTATTFDPKGVCQRAAVVSFLWRAAGSPEPASTVNPFVDVKEHHFYYKAVLWAVENGITNGVDATHFGPYQECNRAQVVTFLWRANDKPAFTATECPFTDVEAGEWYEAPILWAVENGITNGMGDGTFGIETACNRAQVVTFLYRAMAK